MKSSEKISQNIPYIEWNEDVIMPFMCMQFRMSSVLRSKRLNRSNRSRKKMVNWVNFLYGHQHYMYASVFLWNSSFHLLNIHWSTTPVAWVVVAKKQFMKNRGLSNHPGSDNSSLSRHVYPNQHYLTQHYPAKILVQSWYLCEIHGKLILHYLMPSGMTSHFALLGGW